MTRFREESYRGEAAMDITGSEHCNHESDPEPAYGKNVRRRPILSPLAELIADLSRARVGQLPSVGDCPHLVNWRDNKSIYMDLLLKGLPDIDLDINICYGKAFIRVTL